MKYLLWDFDGTLAYRRGQWAGALLEVLRRAVPECGVSVEDLRAHLRSGFPWHGPENVRPAGQPADHWWARLEEVFVRAFRGAAGLDTAQARRLAREVRPVFIDPTHWRLFEDTVPCLEKLRSYSWQHIIVSNHVPELPEIVCALGLSPHIKAIHNSAQLGLEKPNPEMFRYVVATLPHRSDIWMIGDNPIADVSGAEAVGLRAILVRSENPGVRHYCETLRQLPELIEGLSETGA